MGWLFGQNSRKDLIAERVKGWEIKKDWSDPNSPVIGQVKCLRWCLKGNNLWKLMETTRTDDSGKAVSDRWIALDLLRCHPKDPRYRWGYKDIEESMGPCEVNCPLSYIEEAGPDPEWHYDGPSWRDRVRAYWAEQAQQRRLVKAVEVGDVILLKPGWTHRRPMRVTEIRRKGSSISLITSDFIRVPMRAVGEVVKPERVKVGDLPKDMQVLLAEYSGMFLDRPIQDDSEELVVNTLPLSAFPDAPTAEGECGDERYVEQYRGADRATMPPIVMWGFFWIDGRHRVAAAKLDGLTTIRAIDLRQSGYEIRNRKDLSYIGRVNSEEAGILAV